MPSMLSWVIRIDDDDNDDETELSLRAVTHNTCQG